MVVPQGIKPTRLAQKVIDILEPEMVSKFSHRPPEKMRYTSTVRADNNWGTHNCKSVLMFIYPNSGLQNSWIDIHVGCMELQNNFSGKIKLTKGNDGISYYIDKADRSEDKQNEQH